MAKKASGSSRKTVVRSKTPVRKKVVVRKTTSKPEESPALPDISLSPVDIEDVSAHKFVLTPPPPSAAPEVPAYDYLGELPDSYGSKKMFLVARDPYWIFAYWDLTWQQFQEAAHAAHDGKVFLQLYDASGTRLQQIQINEGTKNWYLQGSPESTYFAEVGYYRGDGGFEVVSRSGYATTPRDSLSWKTEARFVTIPFNFTFRDLWALIEGFLLPGEDLAEALARLQEEGFPFPFPTPRGVSLSDAQHQALLDYLGGDFVRRLRVGSLEITETLRRRFEQLRSSGQWVSSFGGAGVSSMSSPFGASFGAGKPRDFFMHVNAELIIYGGTDPKAKVRIDGQDITLREDGTFSYHFTFPDGRFHIPIEATSPDNVETRSALLSFLRLSEYHGDVKKTGQPPLPEPIGRK